MGNRNASIIICTRPESKRLPNKVFKRIAGVTAIEHILNRLEGCDLPIVLAVPKGCRDYDFLWQKYRPRMDIRLFEGNPESPLHRMYDAMVDLELTGDWIIRITHDDILIDKRTMLDLLNVCINTPGCGYGISPMIVEGAGVEIFRRENLSHAVSVRKEPTEYISYFVKHFPFSGEIKYTPRKSVCRNYRLTMDYPNDFLVLNLILSKIGANTTLDRIVEFIDMNPYVMNINKQPLISIYTCAYNAERWVESTVSSIASFNKRADIEYIFVDDCSADDTLLRFSRYYDPSYMKIICNEENKGLAYSCNRALDIAKGKYIIRVDADDWLAPDSLDKMIEKLRESGAGIVYSGYKTTDEDGNIVDDCVDPSEFHHAGCAMMDKSLINEIRFSDGLRHYDGLELYSRIRHRFRVAYLDDVLWFYRQHSKSLSHNNTTERKDTYKKIMGGDIHGR